MDSDKTNQLSNEFEFAFSEILPDLYQLLQSYEISKTFELYLVGLDQSLTATEDYPPKCKTYWDPNCGCLVCKFLPPDQDLGIASKLGIDPEKLQQFCTDIASTLSTSPRFSQLAQQMDGNFAVNMFINLIDPAKTNPEQPAVCHWISDHILQCSNPVGVANVV